MFYTFTQHNSWGEWVFDENLAHFTIVEANTKDEALEIAEKLGIYFNGVNQGIDCECCGDRWDDYTEGSLTPKIYGKDISEQTFYHWGKDTDAQVIVHYLNGDKEKWYSISPKNQNINYLKMRKFIPIRDLV